MAAKGRLEVCSPNLPQTFNLCQTGENEPFLHRPDFPSMRAVWGSILDYPIDSDSL